MQITEALAVCFRWAKLAFPQADMGSHIKVFLPSRASLVQSYCETFSISGVCVCVTAIACVCRVSSLSMSGVCVCAESVLSACQGCMCVCHSTCVQGQHVRRVSVCLSVCRSTCAEGQFSPSRCGSQGLNSSHQHWWQAPLPVESCLLPSVCF